MLQGTEATLVDMMECRERRANQQSIFLHQYHSPVISFCLNIPGPIKTTPEIRVIFEECTALIRQCLDANSISILDSVEYHDHTGDEYLLCINCDDAAYIKKLMTDIEETHPLGRLFDIDVIDVNGIKLSRKHFRKCFLCDRQAQDCAASRRHNVQEMQDAIEAQIKSYLG